jgi:hypothetical protein
MITVRLIKPLKETEIHYQGVVLLRTRTHMLVLAIWERAPLDVGYVQFAPGDQFYEHFYTNRWYNIFEIYRADGTLRGWYCNLTRPACFSDNAIESEDLEIDLFVSADRRTLLVLDEEEYAARGLETSEPDTHRAAMAALDELRSMAGRGDEPFAR